jgi:hypothetical protein
MAAKHMIDAFLGRNTGSWGTPSWSEITGVNSLGAPGNWETAEIRTRASRVIFAAKVALDIGFTARILCDDADTNYTALMTAYRSLTAVVDLLCIDGPTTTVGSFGFRAKFQVANGGQEQPTNDVGWRDFEFKPYPDATETPQFAEVTSGPVITYTAI